MSETDRAVPAQREPSRRTRRLKRVAAAVLGVVAGLALAETAFRARDRGAFPHLNVYVADPELGVRLAPSATQRIALPTTPVTTVRTNADGFRGDELPSPTPDEILVVGDSQVFGLGVEAHETFAAQLQALVGADRRVINAGVPTYGPLEYEKVVARLLAKRRTGRTVPQDPSFGPEKRRTVLYVINMANDLFEATRPNARRHTALDGWAVRVEHAPAKVLDFPGRALLFRDSHLVYALRSLLGRGAHASDGLDPSEASVRDLFGASDVAKAEAARAAEKTRELARLWRDELEKAGADAASAQKSFVDLVTQSHPAVLPPDHWGLEYKKTRGEPGDVVETGTHTWFEGEGESETKWLIKGASVRLHVEKLVLERAEKALAAQHAKLVLASFEAREEAEKRVAALRAKSIDIVRASSPLEPALRRVKAICDAHGAELVVVVLPLDVQVDDAEWKKYAMPRVDMTPTRILNRDIVETAARLEVRSIDALPALAAAQPGAFFDRDLHLTAKGHAAVAAAIHGALASPLVKPPVKVEPPPDRTWPPPPGAWALAKPLPVNRDVFLKPPGVVFGLATASYPHLGARARWRTEPPKGCEAKRIAEWFRVSCRGAVTAVAVTTRPRPELAVDTTAVAGSGFAIVTTPLLKPGDELVADFAFQDGVRTLRIVLDDTAFDLPAGTSTYEWALELGPPRPFCDAKTTTGCVDAKTLVATAGIEKLCGCQKTVFGDASCADLVGAPDAFCDESAACNHLLECARGDPGALPTCPPGWQRVGASSRCHKACDDATPCTNGTCTTVLGTKICL